MATTSAEKLLLQNQLLNAVKNCQKKFNGRAELATELDPCVANLCVTLEKVLTHGLKSSNSIPSALRHVTDMVIGASDKYTLWDVIQSQLTPHEKERYELLRQIWTNRGRGRAWLRSAINEHSLERYMKNLIASPSKKSYYEDWAFVLDTEFNQLLPDVAAGLSPILFALSIDRPELNQASNGEDFGKSSAISDSETVIEDPESGEKRGEVRRPKKTVKNIISFGDEDTSEAAREIVTVSDPVAPPVITTVTQDDDSSEIECAVEATGTLEVDYSTSDNESKNSFNQSRRDSNMSSALRLLSNSTLGELIPVTSCEDNHSSEDSISVPSFSEETETTSVHSTSQGNVEQGVEINDNGPTAAILRSELEKLREQNLVLASQLKSADAASNQERAKMNNRIEELQQENESLKESLLKYISAVQMLKKEGTEFHGEEMFQQKLVQVAGMHAELMELNDRLQRNMISKDVIIKRLYLELEALRGPLGPSEIDISAEMVSLWVPSVFMSGSPRSHHVYQIHIRAGAEEWNVYRRYSEFYDLHKDSKKQYPVISAFQFPPKKTIGNKDTKFVEDRRIKLQQYLRRLVNYFVANHPQLSTTTSKANITSAIPFFGESRETPSRTSRNRISIVANSPQYVGL
ncbi:RUN domain [Nesidiocoris tenuis]|uniref:RUN domain n=1 Tax=Nesidiocoris tenuis TaxID=355587 RepID=A0ABN7B0W6_9HEMI|nr:RUN domain [Nesidiocoris tenuis]